MVLPPETAWGGTRVSDGPPHLGHGCSSHEAFEASLHPNLHSFWAISQQPLNPKPEAPDPKWKDSRSHELAKDYGGDSRHVQDKGFGFGGLG